MLFFFQFNPLKFLYKFQYLQTSSKVLHKPKIQQLTKTFCFSCQSQKVKSLHKLMRLFRFLDLMEKHFSVNNSLKELNSCISFPSTHTKMDFYKLWK